MSGPKYSDIIIERQQQQRLAEERRQRLEEENRKRLQQQVRKNTAQLKIETGTLLEAVQHWLEKIKKEKFQDRVFYSALTSQKRRIDKRMEIIEAASNPTDIPEMQGRLQLVKNLQLWLQNVEKPKLNETTAEIQREIGEKKHFENQQQLLSDLQEMDTVEAKAYEIPRFARQQAAEEPEFNIQSEVDRVFEELEPYFQYKDAYFSRNAEDLAESIRLIAANTVYDDRYKMDQIELRMKTFWMKKEEYDQVLAVLTAEQEEREQLQLSYASLCEVLDTAQQQTLNTVQLKEEVERLEQEYTMKQETEYIVESMHEVMEELGYDILATDYMVKKKQNIHHQMYEFGFEQAVNIFVSDKCSILFEVTCVGEGMTELSSLEKVRVTEAMETFCSNYTEIKAALKHKGIILENENLSPADERYARKVDISHKQVVKQAETRTTRKKQRPVARRMD